MRSHYHSIYLSPHLDDAALSCGGQIHALTAAGQTVLVATIMAGEPTASPLSNLARNLHQRWRLSDKAVVLKRRAEDREACQILGADHVHWEIPDCIYRTHPRSGQLLYTDEAAIFGQVHEAEEGLVDTLARKIAGLPKWDQLIVPLTVGNHVDHQITRASAERGTNANLAYYEDYPYARTDGAMEAVISKDGLPWESRVIPLNAQDVRARIDSVAAYASQFSSFFEDRNDLEQQIALYTQRVGGERLWFQAGGFRGQSFP